MRKLFNARKPLSECILNVKRNEDKQTGMRKSTIFKQYGGVHNIYFSAAAIHSAEFVESAWAGRNPEITFFYGATPALLQVKVSRYL